MRVLAAGIIIALAAACGGGARTGAAGASTPPATPEPPPPPPPPPPPLVVTVLAYNVWFLPPVARDIPERAALIPRHLSSYDAVVLSEAFDDTARTTVVSAMEAQGYVATPVLGSGRPVQCTRSLGPIQVSVDLRMNGGVVVLGRHRLERWEQRTFSPVCAGEDCCAAKGVMYARFVTEDNLCLHVFGTHLQNMSPEIEWGSPRDVRARQLAIVREFIDQQADVASCPGPVIVAGDLNLAEADLAEAARVLRAHVPEHRVGPRSYGDHASYAPGARPTQLDWILVTQDYESPVYSVNETRVFRERHAVTGGGIVAFTSDAVADLSDHHPVAGHFEWRRAVNPVHLTRCDSGLGPCAGGPEPRRCTQAADPTSTDPASFDDYVCYGE